MYLLNYQINQYSNFNLIIFAVVQEAVGTGNPELIQMVLAHRDYQRYCNRVAGIPELLHKLKQVSLLSHIFIRHAEYLKSLWAFEDLIQHL